MKIPARFAHIDILHVCESGKQTNQGLFLYSGCTVIVVLFIGERRVGQEESSQ